MSSSGKIIQVVSADIVDGTIVNADVNAAAAIAYSKLALAASIVSGDLVDGTIATADLAANATYQAGMTSAPAGADQTSSTTSSWIDITGASVALTLVAGSKVLVIAKTAGFHSAANGRFQIGIRDSGGSVLASSAYSGVAANIDQQPNAFLLYTTAGAGSFTFKVSFQIVDAGTVTIRQSGTDLIAIELKK